ncbi:HAD-IA family hydrolase [Arenibaculum pallidiluteum]|uniref:HAD-IA family hydrolase n=1 Tax=Arenibaculum pallidiluteum TaxID=2812559 RepID=UPI001A95FD6C|nr:HAD-IA family hydrolase [Arenibaculum pallidiluteum]
MELRAVIFDVDGTLAETEELHRRAFNEAFARFGLPWRWDRETYRRLLATTGGKERLRRHARDVGMAEAGLPESLVAEIHAFKNARYHALVESGGVALRPGIAELIGDALAAGLRLGIATTTSPSNVDTLLRATLGPGWRSQFAAVAAGDQVPRKKPAPDVYHAALADLGLDGDDCLALEDSRNGVLAAVGAGIPVAVTPSLYTAGEDFSGAVAVLGPDAPPPALAAVVSWHAAAPRVPGGRPGGRPHPAGGAAGLSR